MSATINPPRPALPEGQDEREEWSTPRVILSDIRSTDKTYDLADGKPDATSTAS